MTHSIPHDFDIVVISLPERDDRRRALLRNFRSHGIDPGVVSFFDAIRPSSSAGFPSVGAHGCFRSHLEVMRSASARTKPTLICEDDLYLSPDFNERIGAFLDSLRALEWDIVYFGAHLCGQPGTHLASRAPTADLALTHMIAYEPDCLRRLIPYLEEMMSRPADSPRGPMHFDFAISAFRRDNPDIVTRVAIPPLGFQTASGSDVQIRRWHDHILALRMAVRLGRACKNWLRRRGWWAEKPTA